jgi:DNA-directed RNA polymerase specialized sigma24 family protein
MSPRLYPLDVSPAPSPAHEADELPVSAPADESTQARLLSRHVAYGRQFGPALRSKALSHARRHLGAKADPADVHDLVQSVLADTWSGRLSWDPDRTPLVDHVCDEVHSRARHAREHARRFRRVPLPSVDESSDQIGAAAALSAPPIAASKIEEDEERAERARLLDDLRRLVAGDEAASAILRVSGEPDATLRARSGLSGWEYANAMSKLRRLARQLRGAGRDNGRAFASPAGAAADRAGPQSGAGYRRHPRSPRVAGRGGRR